ncbi:MAG TPA: hypothetical protein VK172_09385 [Lentimicrobium sp.]|nr:hypothetical protein [Lentimicrobium sp.]
MTDSHDEIKKRDEELPGYPSNSPSEDVFNRMDREEDVDPDNPYEEISPAERGTDEFTKDLTLGDLDVPGSELDDDMEIIGNEDEENNYYSLGDDENDSLEDDSLR